MNKLKFLLIILMAVFGSTAFSQQRTITGQVMFETDKAPVSGASIVIKGTHKATTSSDDGKFSIGVPAGKVSLVISSVGYISKEVSVDESSNSIDVFLS